MGIIDELGLIQHERKWTPEKIFEIAKRYDNRTKFYEEQSAAYEAARYLGIIKDVLAHMPICRIDESCRHNLYVIYLYADEESKVGYVGLTKNLKRRHYQHSNPHCRSGKYDSVGSYFINQGKPLPSPQILYSELCPEDASRMEIKAYHDYVEKGWTMLNDEKELGALGGNVRKWNLSLIKELIKSANIEYMIDFMKTFKKAYRAARAHGWLEELNLKYINKQKGYWTRERVIEAMNSFDTLVEFSSTMPGVYNEAVKMGIDMSHLKTREMLPKHYWTEERVREAAESCKTLSEFRKMRTAYQRALDLNILDEFTWLKRGIKHWTLEEATELAKSVNSWPELKKLSESCEAWCVRNKVDFPWFKPRIKRKPRTSNNKTNKEDD